MVNSKVMQGIRNDFLNVLVQTVPVRTGMLKNSLQIEVRGTDLIIKMLGYGKHVEFGTVNQRANPFIRTAVFTELKNIIKKNMEMHA